MTVISPLNDAMDILGVTVFERVDNGSFVAFTTLPPWFAHAYASAMSISPEIATQLDEFELGRAFPYIDNFLVDAELVWSLKTGGPVNSGIWSESSANGEDFYLEARAFSRNNRQFILLENKTGSFADHQSVYQKARNIALANEMLMAELNNRQRRLHSDLEKNFNQNNSLDQLSDAVQNDDSAVMICKPDGHAEVVNKALVDIYHLDDGKDFRSSALLDQWLHEAERNYPEIKRVLLSGCYWEGEFESEASGEHKWIRLTIGPVKNQAGDVIHYLCVANDISNLRNPEETEELAQSNSLTDYDYCTHLPNRRYFWRHLQETISSWTPDAGGIAIIYIDLDYFKRINDELGHSSGDFLLSTVASRISRCVKASDFVAHLGSDEFAVFAQYLESESQVLQIANRTLASLREPLFISGYSYCITASIGIAYESLQRINPTEFVKRADQAMYHAKDLGRNQVQIYTQNLSESSSQRLQREHELQRAIRENHFELHFQPQLSAGNFRCQRVEVLTRWQHPELGLLIPDDFIPIAEDSGLIVPLGKLLLRSACEAGMKMHRSGIDITIAVNVSAKQIKDANFVGDVTLVLEESSFPATSLELEITETSFLKDMKLAKQTLQGLRDLGITIALDDFGMGFSSLGYLRNLPVDYLKIDRSFVTTLEDNTESRAITSTIISLAKTLNMQVIAEGVETMPQVEFLQEKNCDLLQGFYFFPPMPISQFCKSCFDIDLNEPHEVI